jgi:hypothetical protein
MLSPGAPARQKREQLSEALENKVLAWVGLGEGKRKNRSFLCRGEAHAFGLISLLLSSPKEERRKQDC